MLAIRYLVRRTNLTRFRRRYEWAIHEWIASICWKTYTVWNMRSNVAFCISAACTGTRILTLILNTRFVEGTVAVYDAFWSTILIRISKITGNASTRTGFILLSTNSISTTRRWRAGWTWFFWFMFCNKKNIKKSSLKISWGSRSKYLGKRIFVPITAIHDISGFPVKPTGQEHLGEWLIA